LSFVDWRGIKQGQHRLGEGRRTWRLASLGTPTARTCALQAGKSAWEGSAWFRGTRTPQVFAFLLSLFRLEYRSCGAAGVRVLSWDTDGAKARFTSLDGGSLEEPTAAPDGGAGFLP